MKAAQIERHEKTRSDWVMQHKASGSRLSDRRMSNDLRLKAARKNRAAAGAAESGFHEARIKSFVSRWISGGEDQTDRGGRVLWAAILSVPALLAVGPMLALSSGLYRGSTEIVLRQRKLSKSDQAEDLSESEKRKRSIQRIPKALPWVYAGAALLVIATIATPLLPVRVIQPWPWKVLYEPMNLLFVYLLWQLGLGVLLTSWQVRRHGWPGVVLKASPKAPTVPTGRGVKVQATEPAPVQQEAAAPTPPPVPPTGPKAPKLPTAPKPVVAKEEVVDINDFEDEEFEDWMADEADIEEEGNKNNV